MILHEETNLARVTLLAKQFSFACLYLGLLIPFSSIDFILVNLTTLRMLLRILILTVVDVKQTKITT